MGNSIGKLSHVSETDFSHLDQLIEQNDVASADARTKDTLLPAEAKPERKLSGTSEKKKIEEASGEIITPTAVMSGWFSALTGLITNKDHEVGIEKIEKSSGDSTSRYSKQYAKKKNIRPPHSDELEGYNRILEDMSEILKDSKNLQRMQEFLDRNLDALIAEARRVQGDEIAELGVSTNKMIVMNRQEDIDCQRAEQRKALDENLKRAKDNRFWSDLQGTASITASLLGACAATCATVASGGAVTPFAVGLWLSVGVSLTATVDQICNDAAKHKAAQILSSGDQTKEENHFQRIKTLTTLITTMTNLISLVGGSVSAGAEITSVIKGSTLITGGAATGVQAVNKQRSDHLQADLTLIGGKMDVSRDDLKKAIKKVQEAYQGYIDQYSTRAQEASSQHQVVVTMFR